jgi:hypothetical protein
LHLVHHIGTVDFHGARADAEIESDLLIGSTFDQAADYIVFTWRERGKSPLDFGALSKAFGRTILLLQCCADTRQQDASSNGFSKKSAAPIFITSTASATSGGVRATLP